MIEEIVRPDYTTTVFILGVVMITGVVIITISILGCTRFKFFIGGMITGTVLIILPVIFANIYDPIPDWEKQVSQQIESLPCEELEEAYDIYEMESIKGLYKEKCLGKKDPWYT